MKRQWKYLHHEYVGGVIEAVEYVNDKHPDWDVIDFVFFKNDSGLRRTVIIHRVPIE